MKNKITKSHILIAVYAILIITELLFCVPYNRIEVFRSEQNVPHIEIIGNGYTSILEIRNDVASVEGKEWTATGKRVDRLQLLINITLTTLIAAALYFIFPFRKKTNASKTIKSPDSGEQLSLFDAVEEQHSTEEITLHTLSPKNGYYKDTVERTEENSALIDKWLDKSTDCLYMLIMYRNGEAESMLVTKELFDTVYKQFDL